MGKERKIEVWITGDIHGDPRRFSTSIFPEQKGMTKDDIVIILGDFGLVWDYKGENKNERYLLNWLDDKPFTTLFVDGNHENMDRLDTYPVEYWNGGKVHKIRNSVIHLMRGQVFNIQNKTFFSFGGGSSHDIRDGILDPSDPEFRDKKRELNKDPCSLYRINHVSWWERELPSCDEMEEGLLNLKNIGNRVDYIITHSPYTSILRQMDVGSGLYKNDILTDYLQTIKQNVDYKHFFFGHMHQNKIFLHEKTTCLYEQIIRIL